MFNTLIVGFGRAGRQLHLPVLEAMRAEGNWSDLFDGRIGVVEPNLDDCSQDESFVHFYDLPDTLKQFDPSTTVVHVCTAPDLHVPVIQQAVNLGYVKFIVEKPLSYDIAEVDQLLRLEQDRGIEIIIIYNWLFSTMVEKLRRIISTDEFGTLRRLEMRQNKPRYALTLRNSGHATAFDVEMPHEVALALYLNGPFKQLFSATCSDMVVGSARIPNMGKAEMTLMHQTDATSLLISDLMCHVRERSVDLYFDSHRIKAYFPCSAADHYSRFTVSDSNDQELTSELLEDNQLRKCFESCYEYFKTGSRKPPSDLAFSKEVVSALSLAKEFCHIRI